MLEVLKQYKYRVLPHSTHDTNKKVLFFGPIKNFRETGTEIKEMSVLKRCQYGRDVCMGEMSVWERCLYLKDVGISEMSV